MWLYFTLRSSGAEKSFCCFHSDEMEPLMEILNHFAVSGRPILSAFLEDEAGQRTSLPTEVFDGSPIAYGMRLLQREYQQVLHRENKQT